MTIDWLLNPPERCIRCGGPIPLVTITVDRGQMIFFYECAKCGMKKTRVETSSPGKSKASPSDREG